MKVKTNAGNRAPSAAELDIDAKQLTELEHILWKSCALMTAAMLNANKSGSKLFVVSCGDIDAGCKGSMGF